MIAASDSAGVLVQATHVLFHTTAAFQAFNRVVFFSPLPPLHTTNTFPRSDSTCAQGICLRVSQQIGLGQGLSLASSNRLLKTAPQHDERGKWIFQLKSRIISAQGIILCSKRLIKWDAIDTALRCCWISAGHVHWQLLAACLLHMVNRRYDFQLLSCDAGEMTHVILLPFSKRPRSVKKIFHRLSALTNSQ